MQKKDIRKFSKMIDRRWSKKKHKYYNDRDASKFDFNLSLKNLSTVYSILNKEKLTFWLTDGFLLAAYRDKDFLPWDNEIDIDMFEEDLLSSYKRLKKVFMYKRFIVRGHNDKQCCKVNLFRYKTKVSIRGLFLDSSYEDDYYRMSRVYRYPKHFFDKFDTVEFKGMTFKTPYPIEEYLEYVFGSGWTVPDSNKDAMKQEWTDRGVRRSPEDRAERVFNDTKKRKSSTD